MNPLQHRLSQGFTLLEVLVAVAILAIALSAIIAGGARYASTASDLREKTLALWVAHNRLTEIELAPVLPQIGTSNDDVDMGGEHWTWRVKVQNTQDPTLRRVDIRVMHRDSKNSLVSLSAFLSSNGRKTSQ